MKKEEYLNGYSLLKEYGFSYEEVVKIMDDCSFQRIDNNNLGLILDRGCKFLLDKGYNLDEIKKMVLINPRSLTVSDMKRKVIEDTFLELGMTNEELKFISIKCGNIYAYSKERIDGYINFFRDIGFSNKEIIKIFKYTLFILRSSVSKFKKLYDDMINAGFNASDIHVMAKGNHSFWAHSFSKIENIMKTFIDLGFSDSQVKVILRRSSSLLGYGEDTIRKKFNDLINLGFSREQLIYIVSDYPTLINGDIKRTQEIIDFFKNVGLYECLLENPKGFFMQGIETSYARYCFYMEKNKVIDKDSYMMLFYGWQRFERLYGIGKDELLDKYPYNKDIVRGNKR